MKKNNNHSDYLTSDQVAQMFGVSERTIRTWRRNGYIPFIKLGKTVRFTKSDIDNALNRYKHGQ